MTRALLQNMVIGVTQGYEKKLEINGVGYTAVVEGSDLVLNLGFAHPVRKSIPSTITVKCPSQTDDRDPGLRQAAGRGVRCRDSQAASARALQGQGHQVPRRGDPSQGGQGLWFCVSADAVRRNSSMVNPRKRKAAHRRTKAMSARYKIRKRAGRPRLSVFRSLTNIYCQIIDDESGRTLASASSAEKQLRADMEGSQEDRRGSKGRFAVGRPGQDRWCIENRVRPWCLQVPRPGQGTGRGRESWRIGVLTW